MNIPLTLGDYNGRSGTANCQELVNMMAEADIQGGVSPFILVNTPGCETYIDVSGMGEGRGGYMYPSYCLAVVGDNVYRINTTNEVKEKVYTLLTTVGAVNFAENPTQIMLIDGTYGYVYTKSTNKMTRILDADFPTPKACCFKDGYGVVVAADTGRLYSSAINDFTSWAALDFVTAEYKPDNLVSCLAAIDSLFALGEKTVQTYYNSGSTTFPFDNRQGANMSVGCGAKDSVAEGQNLAFFVDDSFQVRMIDGYVPRVISTPQIDYRIARLTDPETIRGFLYVQDGHSFYAMLHPELCLVYDITTSQWQRRISGVNDARYRPGWIAQYGSMVLAGDYTNGKIYQLKPDVYQDNGLPTPWRFTLQAVQAERKMIEHHMLEITIDTGDGPGTPQLWMQYSDTAGKTWSTERWESMGEIGEFGRRVRWDALGQSRNRTYRIGGSDPVPRNIVAAKLEGVVLGF